MREAIAICQSLPGPLAIQVGIYAAYSRGGFWGAWIGGWAFIFPDFVIVAALGALYVYLGDLKPVTAIFYGVSPAVIALILHSCYRLAKLGMEDWLQWAIAFACFDHHSPSGAGADNWQVAAVFSQGWLPDLRQRSRDRALSTAGIS